MPYAGDELYKYIRSRMPDFFIINVVELLPHLHCLSQMDQEKIKAEAKYNGNEFAVPTLLDSVRRRGNWERLLIDALWSNAYNHLADDLERKLESLTPRRPVVNPGASAFSHPNSTAAASSMVYDTSPPRAPLAVSLPNNSLGTVAAADNSESTPRVFSPADYLPSHANGLQSSGGICVAQCSGGTPVPVTPVVQTLAGPPVPVTPVVQSSGGTPVPVTPVVQTLAGPPVPVTPVVQSSGGPPVPVTHVAQSSGGTPVPVTPVVQTLAGPPVPVTPVVQTSAGPPVPVTPVVQSSGGPPVPVSPVMQTLAGPPVPVTPVVQTSGGPPVPVTPVVQTSAPTANLQPSALLVATSNTSFATSSASSIAADSSRRHNSTELKKPIQEMGNLVDKEESQDYNLPVQVKIVTSGHPKPRDSPRVPTHRTINSDQNNSGEKSKVNKIFSPSTDQAEGKTKTDQVTADVPSTSRQVHPHRPPLQPDDDDDQAIDKPGVLRSDAANMLSVTEVAVDAPEGACSTRSSDLQFSESTVDTSKSNSSNSSSPLPNLYPTNTSQQASPLSLDDSSSSGASVSDDFSDKNSIKEQKIQALRGYQNDHLSRSFIDVHNPLNIQLNFDAQKNTGEGASPDQDILNQNLTIEHTSTAMFVPMSNTQVAQSIPAFTSTHPANNRADSEVEFLKNVQVNNSTDTISSSDLMLSSSDSDCSLVDSSANNDSVNEPRFHVEQNANILNNIPQLLPSQIRGAQVPAQTDVVRENAWNQNQTTAHECKPESIGDRSIYFDCNQSHEDSCTKSDKESGRKSDVAERGGSLHSRESEGSHGKYDISPDDVKMHIGRIVQEPDYENEAANDHEFEAAKVRDFSGRDSGEGCVNASSTEHVSLASQKRSEARQAVNPNGDLPHSNYGFVSVAVLVVAVVAGCIWKFYHK
uniref:uncharacterized protein n=1 Tax=Pristiophorus japonicus TaxID=55135 RepID=UPI00398EE107